MKFFNKKHFITLLVSSLLLTTIGLPVSLFAVDPQVPVNLGSTSSFAVLAGTTITSTGPTTINGSLPEGGGNIGVSPGSAITQLPIITMTGWTTYSADAVAEQAQADLTIAYKDAADRIPTNTISADLGGQTLTPGVYSTATSIGITGTLTLDAQSDPEAVFVFQAGSTLITASGSEVKLINGAKYCRIFWQVGSSATLGTNSEFVGHIFASESITVTNGASIQGQLLAINGAVTLDTNKIINGFCSAQTPVQTGSLTVTKTLSAPADFDLDKVFTFTIKDSAEDVVATVTLKGGESKTIPDLKVGEYIITESNTAEAGYDWNVTVSDAASTNGGSLTVTAGSQTVAFTNTYIEQSPVQTGSLTVTKTLSAPAGFDLDKVFTFTVKDSAEDIAATVTLKGGESKTIPDLEVGTYTITESDAAVADYNWDVTVSGYANTNGGTLTVAAGLQTVDFTNTYVKKTGSLTVTKTLSAPADFDMNKLFTFTVKDSAGDKVATVTLKGGESTTLPDLEVGTYTVTESDATVADYNWAVTVSGAASTNGGSLTVAAGSQTVAFTNAYIEQSSVQTGSLTVTKTLSAPAGFDMSKQFTFTLRNAANAVVGTATIGNGGSATFNSLEPGTYTITESGAAVAGYNWDVTVSGAANTNGGSMTVAAGLQTVAFTNTYVKLAPVQTGSLTVTKTLSAPAGFYMDKLFVFTLRNAANAVVGTATIRNGESATFNSLEPGSYTITESGAAVEDYIWYVTVSGAASSNAGTLTVAAGSQTVAFTNTYIKQSSVQTGSLTVIKTLSAPAGFDMSKQFTFTLRNAANAVVGTATIGNGGSATFNSLEPGTYTITESGAAVKNYIWDVTVSGAAISNAGILTVAAGSQTVAFTNTYVKQTITEVTTVAQTTVEETTVAQTTAEETTVAQTTAEETTTAQTTVAETTTAQTTAAETTAVAETTAAQTTKSITKDIKTVADITEVITENAATYKAGDTESVTVPQTSDKNLSGFVIGIVLLSGISVIIIYKSKKNK